MLKLLVNTLVTQLPEIKYVKVTGQDQNVTPVKPTTTVQNVTLSVKLALLGTVAVLVTRYAQEKGQVYGIIQI